MKSKNCINLSDSIIILYSQKTSKIQKTGQIQVNQPRFLVFDLFLFYLNYLALANT